MINKKIRYQGRKQEVEILEFDDIIKEGFYFIFTGCTEEFYKNEYNGYLNSKSFDLLLSEFSHICYISQAAGDKVSEHSSRVYFRVVKKEAK